MNIVRSKDGITSIFVLLALIFLFYFGCNGDKSSDYSSEIDKSLGIPEGFMPVYSIASVKNISGAGVNRIALRITVPKGLSKAQLEINMKIAAKNYYLKNRVNSVTVFAYLKGTDLNDSYSAGMCDFISDGTGGYKAEIDFSKYYFKPETKTLAIGAKVLVVKKSPEGISISRSSDSWMRDDIISNVKSGTKAEIIDIKVFSITAAGVDVIRYKIKIPTKNIIGWVHSSDVKEI